MSKHDDLPPLLRRFVESIEIIGNMACYDHMAMYDLRDALKRADALQAELAKCGRDNCFGRKSKDATTWITLPAHEKAIAAEKARADALEAALKELCYLKRLKDWMNKPGSAYEKFDGREFEAGEAVAEYDRRKPLAWAAARALLEKPQ